MELFELKEKGDFPDNIKLNRIYRQFQEILKELRKRELPEKIVELINPKIEDLNSTSYTDKELIKLFKKKQKIILELLEKESKIVPKNHYRNLWMAVGMSAFGLPIGVVLGLTVLDNVALLGIGVPIGMAIGIALGSGMDKKALKEGRQLDLEIKY